MKKIVLSTMALLMMSGVAIAKENCSDKYVENQIEKYGSKKEKELLHNIQVHKDLFALPASLYGSILKNDDDKRNYCKAIYFSKQASKYGLSGAQYDVGTYYDIGKGVKKDWEKAKEWYRKSVDTDDNPLALFALGSIYEDELNIEKAVYWYKRLVNSKNSKKSLFPNLLNHANQKIKIYGAIK